MAYSIELIKQRFESGKEVIKQWISGPEQQLEEFMTVASDLAAKLNEALGNAPLDAEAETNLQKFKTLQLKLSAAASPPEIQSIKTDLAVCLRLTREELTSLIESAKAKIAEAEKAKQDVKSLVELVQQTEDALIHCKQASIEKDSALAVAEFLEKNEGVIESMISLKTILETLLQQKTFQEFEIKSIENYLNQIDDLLASHQELNLIEIVMADTTNPAETILALEQKIKRGKIISEQFSQYTQSLIQLALSQESIDLILISYETNAKECIAKMQGLSSTTSSLNLAGYTLIPVQMLPRFPLLLREVQKTLTKERDFKPLDPRLPLAVASADISLDFTKKISTSFNAKVDAREIAKTACAKLAQEKMVKARHPKIKLLKTILELNLNNSLPVEQSITSSVQYFDVYLKNLLAHAYQDDFSFDHTSFSISKNGELITQKNYALILLALGITNEKKPRFNCAKFNPVELDKLFALDQNPLWLVLKSTIPISTKFNATQKINTYIALAQAYYDKKIGGHNKYLGALHMARAAYAVANDYPTEENNALVMRAFKPLGKITESEIQTQCRTGQFGDYIVDKHVQNAKEKSDVLELKRTIVAELNRNHLKSRDMESYSSLPSSTTSDTRTSDSAIGSSMRRPTTASIASSTITRSKTSKTSISQSTIEIEAFILMASEYQRGKHGSKDKYLGVYEMALNAYDAAAADPTEKNIELVTTAFAPQGSKDKRDIEQQCKDKQFGDYLVDKHVEHVLLRKDATRKQITDKLNRIRSLKKSTSITALSISSSESNPEVFTTSSPSDSQREATKPIKSTSLPSLNDDIESLSSDDDSIDSTQLVGQKQRHEETKPVVATQSAPAPIPLVVSLKLEFGQAFDDSTLVVGKDDLALITSQAVHTEKHSATSTHDVKVDVKEIDVDKEINVAPAPKASTTRRLPPIPPQRVNAQPAPIVTSQPVKPRARPPVLVRKPRVQSEEVNPVQTPFAQEQQPAISEIQVIMPPPTLVAETILLNPVEHVDSTSNVASSPTLADLVQSEQHSIEPEPIIAQAPQQQAIDDVKSANVEIELPSLTPLPEVKQEPAAVSQLEDVQPAKPINQAPSAVRQDKKKEKTRPDEAIHPVPRPLGRAHVAHHSVMKGKPVAEIKSIKLSQESVAVQQAPQQTQQQAQLDVLTSDPEIVFTDAQEKQIVALAQELNVAIRPQGAVQRTMTTNPLQNRVDATINVVKNNLARLMTGEVQHVIIHSQNAEGLGNITVINLQQFLANPAAQQQELINALLAATPNNTPLTIRLASRDELPQDYLAIASAETLVDTAAIVPPMTTPRSLNFSQARELVKRLTELAQIDRRLIVEFNQLNAASVKAKPASQLVTQQRLAITDAIHTDSREPLQSSIIEYEIEQVQQIVTSDHGVTVARRTGNPVEKYFATTMMELHNDATDEDDARATSTEASNSSRTETSMDEAQQLQPRVAAPDNHHDQPRQAPATTTDVNRQENNPKKRRYMPYILAAIGGVLGAGLGVGLIMTGVFAPFGAGVIALTVTGVAAGITGVGFAEILRRTYNKLFGRKEEPRPPRETRNQTEPLSLAVDQNSHSLMSKNGLGPNRDATATSANIPSMDPSNTSQSPFPRTNQPSASEVNQATAPVPRK